MGYNTKGIFSKKANEMKGIKQFWIVGIISLLLLSGCINLQQEILVNEDGSGILRFAYGVDTVAYPQFEEMLPEGFRFENLFAGLIQDKYVTEVVTNNYETNDQTWQTIQFTVSDMVALLQEERRIGPLLLTIDEEDGYYIFEQSIDLALSNVAIPGIGLRELSGAKYSVRLLTPQVLDTNGTQREAGSSEWKVSIRDLAEEEESMYLSAEYVLEPYEGLYIPWQLYFPYIVYGFLGLGIILILVVIIVNTRGKGDEEMKIKF
jgi:hypothetical protein